jgi:AraC-like DNA-binding protein
MGNIYAAVAAFLGGTYSLYQLLLTTGYIERIPQFYGWGNPIEYTLSPAYYIAIRSYLKNETHFKKTDLIFYLPFLLQSIEMLPFLFSGNEVKINAYHSLMEIQTVIDPQNYGIIPANIHMLLKFIMHWSISIYMWFEIFSFQKKLELTHFYKHPSMLKWIIINASLLSLICFIPILIALSTSNFRDYTSIYSIALSLTCFGTVCTLLFKPWVLYDLPAYYSMNENESNEIRIIKETEEFENEVESNNLSGTFTLDEVTLEQYEQKILTFINENKPFLKPGYAAGDLAVDCNIPKHHLTYLFNRKLEMRYNDFINKHRINYAVEMVKNQDVSQLTIDAIAVNSGFSSRSTFIKYFIKYMGVYPSDFIKKK